MIYRQAIQGCWQGLQWCTKSRQPFPDHSRADGMNDRQSLRPYCSGILGGRSRNPLVPSPTFPPRVRSHAIAGIAQTARWTQLSQHREL
ncbi:MAG: hypothetical protein PUP92_39095 [Rhizonema sp. PD38]|nr:hypothetical protein [Rhizonema sp. PD38]